MGKKKEYADYISGYLNKLLVNGSDGVDQFLRKNANEYDELLTLTDILEFSDGDVLPCRRDHIRIVELFKDRGVKIDEKAFLKARHRALRNEMWLNEVFGANELISFLRKNDVDPLETLRDLRSKLEGEPYCGD